MKYLYLPLSELIDHYEAGASTAEIAKLYGTTSQTVRDRLQRAGVLGPAVYPSLRFYDRGELIGVRPGTQLRMIEQFPCGTVRVWTGYSEGLKYGTYFEIKTDGSVVCKTLRPGDEDVEERKVK